MAVTFDILPSNPIVFTSPSVSLTFTDSTPALSSVTEWSWAFNNTIVSTASSWSHIFFGAQSSVMVLSVTGNNIGSSSQVNVVIEPAWPTYPSFRLLPSNNFSFTPGIGVAWLSGQNTSPTNMVGTQLVSSLTYLSGMVLGTPSITGISITRTYETVTATASTYEWYFNSVPIAWTRDLRYQFFDPISGTIYTDMTSMSFMGTAYYTNSTEFSAVSSIWQTLSSVPAYTEVPGVCSLPSQSIIINTAPEFPTCENFEHVTPVGIRGSTTLNSVVTSYELLMERIKMQIGWPMVNIEICDDQIYDFINQSCEWYTKYAGQTEEYLMFNSSIYVPGYGVKLDVVLNRIADYYSPYTAPSPVVSGQYVDCDLNNYRKVVGIFSADPAGGSGGSSEILFNMDYLFAQQAYFGQMMGGFGYDITTWHLLKSWMDLRKKMFATNIYVNFNPTTQLLRLVPEPTGRGNYVGIIGCRMERPISGLVQERWVQRYTLALTKIALAHIRGKFGGVILFGGGNVNPTDLMLQGIKEKDELEKELMNGYGEAEPPIFFCS